MSNAVAGKITRLDPPLKWAGGKRWLVPHIEQYWNQRPDYRLVELFSGGLAVALGLQSPEALLNDINEHVINLYKWIQRGLVIEIEMLNNEHHYYKLREEFNRLIRRGKADTKKAASIFYYLNRTGYNGLCRFNRSGEYNVPFGSYKSITYRRNFKEYQDLFSDWDFVSNDFEKIELSHRDFVYADPPYDVDFRQYSQNGFGWDDQVRLAEWLSVHKGPVLLSNQATPRITKLYKSLGFSLSYLDGPRRISCNGDRSSAREVLAFRGF